MPEWLEQSLGGLLVMTILIDVFLTVLYARIGSGFVSYRVARVIWRICRAISKPFRSRRGVVLSFCGPIILVAIVFVWALALALGLALIIQPKLGTSVMATSGQTPTDFVSALYAGGGSMSIIGASNFAPQSGGFRLLYLFNSLVGMSVISLTLTYLMQVYNALYRRNATAFSLHLATGETGDAAELVAGLGPQGQYSGGYTSLSELANQMTGVKESHHFYPVLFYFRFPETPYSVSRMALVSLDAVSLIKTALDDKQCAWLKESAPVAQLWRASLIMVTRLAEAFLPGNLPSADKEPDEATRQRWRRRYFAALRRLQQAGIPTGANADSGAEDYIRLRSSWYFHIETLAPALAFDMDDVDVTGFRPEASDERPAFRGRLRSAG